MTTLKEVRIPLTLTILVNNSVVIRPTFQHGVFPGGIGKPYVAMSENNPPVETEIGLLCPIELYNLSAVDSHARYCMAREPEKEHTFEATVLCGGTPVVLTVTLRSPTPDEMILLIEEGIRAPDFFGFEITELVDVHVVTPEELAASPILWTHPENGKTYIEKHEHVPQEQPRATEYRGHFYGKAEKVTTLLSNFLHSEPVLCRQINGFRSVTVLEEHILVELYKPSSTETFFVKLDNEESDAGR